MGYIPKAPSTACDIHQLPWCNKLVRYLLFPTWYVSRHYLAIKQMLYFHGQQLSLSCDCLLRTFITKFLQTYAQHLPSFLLQLIRLKSTSLMAHKCHLLDLETAKSVQNWQWTVISTTPLETEWLWSTIQWMTEVPLVWFTVYNVGTVPTVITSWQCSVIKAITYMSVSNASISLVTLFS